jgi:IclR family KDG regulon transcriptional repressor
MRRVNAVLRAFQVLDALMVAGRPMSVSELSALLGIPRNTTYDLVGTLAEVGVVAPQENGQIWLGFYAFELGAAYGNSVELIRQARDIAAVLSEQTNETCQLAVLDGREVVYLAKEEGRQAVRLVSEVGAHLPAHVTAVGKVQLAYLPPEELSALYDGVTLEQLTPKTVTDYGELRRQLEEIHERGYALDNQEGTPDACCVAAPILNGQGLVVAGLSISAPVSRWSDAVADHSLALLREAAMQLSRRLGYDGAGSRPVELGGFGRAQARRRDMRRTTEDEHG